MLAEGVIHTSFTSKGFGFSAGTWTSSNPFLLWRKEPLGSWQRLLAMKWLPSVNVMSSRSRILREPSWKRGGESQTD